MSLNYESSGVRYDQLDAFKAFWNKWGNLLLALVTVVLLAIAGWRGWGS